MVEQELTIRDIAQRLPTQASPLQAPSAELWPRIAAAHLQRHRRRRVRRFAGAGLLLAAGLAVVALVPTWSPKAAADVDWQARAQALELQLHAVATATDSAAALDTESDNTVLELARIDGALQKAYDSGAQTSELVPLWKQRSELLSALLTARQQQLALTRI
jgi:hypothetical protein